MYQKRYTVKPCDPPASTLTLPPVFYAVWDNRLGKWAGRPHMFESDAIHEAARLTRASKGRGWI